MNKIKTFEQLKTFIRNEPLIEAEPTIAALKRDLVLQSNGSVFFGVGIVSKENISISVPFDILSMFFISEILRQTLDFKKVMVLIADSHAVSNNTFSNAQIENATTKTKSTLQKVITNFNLTNFELLLASQISQEPEFQTIILEKLPKISNEYLRLEIADSLFFQKRDDLKIKLGWTMQKNNREIGHDERFFDRQIKSFCPDLSFVHLKPGRTFNKERQRVSPYLSVNGESRILLEKGEDVRKKINFAKKDWPDPNFGGAVRHLANIVRAFEKLNGNIPNMSLEEKIQFILDKTVE
ncbi:hypothetical protein HY946_00665 [Candidatus Gottesmanbacteria bacterium]|nr:hypothetical protein [Candidatus Gottesmanbacteria bacterium]